MSILLKSFRGFVAIAAGYAVVCIGLVLMGGPAPAGSNSATIVVEAAPGASQTLDRVVRRFGTENRRLVSVADIGVTRPTRRRDLFGLRSTIVGLTLHGESQARFHAYPGGFLVGFPASDAQVVEQMLLLCEELEGEDAQWTVASVRGSSVDAPTEGCSALR